MTEYASPRGFASTTGSPGASVRNGSFSRGETNEYVCASTRPEPARRSRTRSSSDDLSSDAFGAGFSALEPHQQRQLVEALDARAAAEPDDFAGQFYRIVREHTVQGFFGDPAYGGNRDVVGWKLVGFPGAQWGYTAEQMKPGVDARSIPILTVGDLYARIGGGRS